ncbi:hypothetical protein Tco_0888902 [Tanacetum coccineum]
MSPVANSSRVVEANEEVPDIGEHEAVRAITKDFKALFCGETTQWHQLDKDLVEMFYRSFQVRIDINMRIMLILKQPNMFGKKGLN